MVTGGWIFRAHDFGGGCQEKRKLLPTIGHTSSYRCNRHSKSRCTGNCAIRSREVLECLPGQFVLEYLTGSMRHVTLLLLHCSIGVQQELAWRHKILGRRRIKNSSLR